MKIILFTISIIFLFNGCIPKIKKIEKIKDSKIEKELIQDLTKFSSNDIELKNNWWKNYEDSQLNELLNDAIKNAPSIKQLESKYKIARNLTKAHQSKNIPNIDFDSNTSRQRYSKNHIYPAPLAGSYNNLYQTGLALNYDFDFWDERKALIKASKNEALAKQALIKVKELVVYTSITKLYISWNFKIQKIKRLSTLKRLIYEKHDILDKLYKLGLANKSKINQSNYLSEKINQDILTTKAQIEDIKASIGVIGGFLPSRLKNLKKPNITKNYKFYVPKNIHLDVISHLPKIAFQKYLLISKNEYIKKAKAKFYPNINLKALVNFTSFSFVDLLTKSSFSPKSEVAFSLPIFDANKKEENLNAKVNDYNSQVYAYNQTIIEAINEIVKTLKKIDLNKSNIKAQNNVMIYKMKNENIEKEIYKLGLKNKISYLDSKIDIQEEKIKSISLQDKQMQLQINLIKSLGGGYKNKVSNVLSLK
ncbi:TolC family protein [Malaciobacter marinus]|uniref:TolC family protein n=1 Tax=Malaciobacter marinus TaxID=505249 RepID=UPI000C07184F|nr:TolC family protein [Malaciobacter marinus]PHO12975.1 hypothetical protein CPG38_05635 [Malaciobacter marinus]